MLRWKKSWVVAKKDMAEFKKNKIIISTLIGMPLVFSIIMALAVSLPFQYATITPEEMAGHPLLPANVTAEEAKKIIINYTLDTMLTMFMVIPAMIPTIVAAYSFAGEKLNRSLEPLLATPTTDLELFVGKCTAVFIPSIIATVAAFSIFSMLTDILLYPTLGYLALPNLNWLLVIALVSPLLCVLSIESNVYISSRVRDVRAAEQLGVLVTLPMILIFILMIGGIFTISILFILLFAVILFLIDLGLFFVATKTFQRERILTEWK